MTVPNGDGVLPVGAFYVDSWGHHVAKLVDYPASLNYGDALTVMCLNAEGQWTDEYVYDVTVSLAAPWEDPALSTIAFKSGQHGTCGIFPQ
jgi:hypothetical protein